MDISKIRCRIPVIVPMRDPVHVSQMSALTCIPPLSTSLSLRRLSSLASMDVSSGVVILSQTHVPLAVHVTDISLSPLSTGSSSSANVSSGVVLWVLAVVLYWSPFSTSLPRLSSDSESPYQETFTSSSVDVSADVSIDFREKRCLPSVAIPVVVRRL
ncbi:hypothetical protein QCA50_012310 [Cerrena zonata]|uniref:Uncharacterized protein n=1 Tax=Cerrena zonata TaxID=2478898 RepID=A0AAW0G357_9APHY